MAKAKKKEALSLDEKLEQALVPLDEQPYEVPENWCWTKWGQIGDFIAGNGFKNEYQGFSGYDIPFYKVGSLKYADDNGYLYDESNTITEEMREKLKATLIPVNSIIFAKIGEAIRLNRRCINDKVCCIDNNTMAFITHGCNFRYVYYWTLGQEFYDLANATTVPAIRKSDLEEVKIPIPPLAEQQRIVEQIENLFARLDEAKDKLQEALDSYQRRKMSLLYKAYNGELTGGWRTANGIDLNSWSTVTINDISDVKGGKRVPKGMELVTENTGQPYIKAGNLKQGTVIDDGIMYVPDEVHKYIKNYTVKTGDVYITNVGACIGDCGVIPEKYDGANLTENAVKMTNLKCDSDFLALYLETSAVQQMIKGLIASATLGKLSIANIKTIEINLPSMDEQKEIVKIVKEILAKEDITKEQIVKVVQQVDLMKKSILAKAFRGELGTNNPAEESAVELLKSMLEQEG